MPTIIVIVIVLIVLLLIARTAFGQQRRVTSSPRPGVTASSGFTTPASQSGADALADLATCARPHGSGDLTAVVQARVTDPAPSAWHFDFMNGQCTLFQGTSDVAALTVSASGHVWRELAAKRISFDGAFMKGTIQAEGDTSILMRLDDALSGPVEPSRRAVVQPGPVAADPPASNAGSAFGQDVAEESSLPASTSIFSAGGNNHASVADARAALVQAMKDLPAGASQTQRMEAVRSALLASGGLASLTAGTSPALKGVGMHNVLAICAALANLPPGASAEAKRDAVRAAIVAGASGPATHEGEGGIGEHLKGTAIEGLVDVLLEGFLGGA